MGIGSSMVGTIPNIISIIIWDRGDGVLFIAKKLLLGVSLDKFGYVYTRCTFAGGIILALPIPWLHSMHLFDTCHLLETCDHWHASSALW